MFKPKQLSLALSLLICGASVGFVSDSNSQTIIEAEREELRGTLERILLENILPFWIENTRHDDGPGFSLNHDIRGEWQGASPRHLVAQARMVWFYSHLYQSPYGEPRHLALAEPGFAFLTEHMRDKQHGGYYWQTQASGKASDTQKHLYGQAFALYALSEYYKASGNPKALHYADKLFKTLESHAHDSEHGGYVESFARDWSGPPDTKTGKLSQPHHFKLMNTHLHLMEAVTTYLEASNNPLARERLAELVRIETNAVVRKSIGACTDKFLPNWLPAGPEFEQVSYGHDIENVWLVMQACHALGVPDGPYLDLYHTLFDYAFEFGYDYENGGFYHTGGFNQPADDRSKIWWVQAEGLTAALMMYRRSGDERYFEAFRQTLNWINEHMVDWENGDWFSSIQEDGAPAGGKAHGWKTAYHNGRAMLQCLKVLKQLEAEE